MLASILISAVSVILLVYWFRYTCLILLRQQNEESVNTPQARLGLLQAEEQVSNEPELDPLHQSLERDYRLLTYLLQHAGGVGTPSIEDRLLKLDYLLMRAWYRLTRSVAPQCARRALMERAAVVDCLARKMGSHARLQPEM